MGILPNYSLLRRRNTGKPINVGESWKQQVP